ncbi:hypothetical protein HK100_006846 [Physocladia obscura]|uniref:Uncharacterized protein n=1 Tax=Physocladia obscura TaxID=109957 RepID=A0AAD5X794_9FUNG|nr:hypothetical protein HK100_006846 [Physocladia obscura]
MGAEASKFGGQGHDGLDGLKKKEAFDRLSQTTLTEEPRGFETANGLGFGSTLSVALNSNSATPVHSHSHSHSHTHANKVSSAPIKIPSQSHGHAHTTHGQHTNLPLGQRRNTLPLPVLHPQHPLADRRFSLTSVAATSTAGVPMASPVSPTSGSAPYTPFATYRSLRSNSISIASESDLSLPYRSDPSSRPASLASDSQLQLLPQPAAPPLLVADRPTPNPNTISNRSQIQTQNQKKFPVDFVAWASMD